MDDGETRTCLGTGSYVQSSLYTAVMPSAEMYGTGIASNPGRRLQHRLRLDSFLQ